MSALRLINDGKCLFDSDDCGDADKVAVDTSRCLWTHRTDMMLSM